MKINVLNIIFSYDIQVAVNNFECQYNGPELEKLLANNFSSSGQFVDFNPTQSSLDFANLDFYTVHVFAHSIAILLKLFFPVCTKFKRVKIASNEIP